MRHNDINLSSISAYTAALSTNIVIGITDDNSYYGTTISLLMGPFSGRIVVSSIMLTTSRPYSSGLQIWFISLTGINMR